MMSERDELLLKDYLADALEPNDHAAVEAHLATCQGCRDLLEEIRLDDRELDALISSNPHIEPPADLHERIFDSDEFAAIQRDSAKHAAVTPPHAAQARRFLSSSPFAAPRVLLPASGALLVVLALVAMAHHIIH